MSTTTVMPGSWTTTRLSWLFKPVSDRGHEDAMVLSVYRDHGLVPKDSRTDNSNRTPENLSNYQLVRSGDLVVNRMKAWQGSLGISEHYGIVSPDYEVLRPVGPEYDRRFLHLLLRSPALIDQYALRSIGIRPSQWRLYWDEMKTIEVCLPSVAEQTAIADYLDLETARIDALIEEQQRLVEMLEGRKRAVVDAVVTRGLKADAQLVNSDVEWIGPIPEGWHTRPLWSMFRRMKDIDHQEEQMLSVFRDHGVVAKDSRENTNQTAENRSIYQLVHPGWLVTNRMKAWRGSVGISSLRGIVSGHYICFAPLHSEDSGYLNWLFRSPRYALGYGLMSRGVRIGQAEIDNDHYRVLPVVVPPLDEQRQISAHLDEETAKIELLIAETERFIELSKERRSALITAVVTGQIDVRAAA